MIERPILMSAPMVRAAMREVDPKGQTRRVVKNPDYFGCITGDCPHYDKRQCANDLRARSPYGMAGDRLWVRETLGVTAQGDCEYMADGKEIEDPRALALCERYGDTYHFSEVKGIPSIFMPRWACRLLLEVTDVRVERLQDISIADIDAEGLDSHSAASITHAETKIAPVPEHWISGADEGLSYCRPCGEKEIKKLEAKKPGEEYTLDGGYRTEGDSQAFCETCHCQLDNSFTDYACGSELDHFEENGFDVNSASDCYSFQNILSASLWKGGEHSERVRKLAYRALWDSLNAKRAEGAFAWAKNPYVWVVSFKRVR